MWKLLVLYIKKGESKLQECKVINYRKGYMVKTNYLSSLTDHVFSGNYEKWN